MNTTINRERSLTVPLSGWANSKTLAFHFFYRGGCIIMKRLCFMTILLLIMLYSASQASAYDTAGCMVKADTTRFNHSGLTQLTWTAQVFEYTYNSPTTGTLRIEFNSVGFMGSGGGAYIGAMIQNVGHSFPDDASTGINVFPGLGLYLTSLQSDLPNSKYGVELLVDPNQYPQFGRCFQNIDGTGFSGKNIYTRQNVGTPSAANPIIVRWIVTKGATVVNPSGNFSKDINGNWVPLVGTFVKWNFKIEINGVMYNVANFFLPIEKAEYLNSTDPLVFHQEYFGSASQQLDGDKVTVRYVNSRAYDASNSYDLDYRKIVLRIDDEAGNLDNRFGWKSDSMSITSRAGHQEDVNECFRDVGTLFQIPSSQSFYVEGGTGSLNVGVPSSYSWTAISNSTNWLTITSPQNNTGSGTVNFSVALNESTIARTGTLTIAGQLYTIKQKGQFVDSLQPRDFGTGDWLYEDYGGQGSTTLMSYIGIQTYPAGTISNTGPVYSSTANFGYVMFDQARNLFLLHPIAGNFNPRRGTSAGFSLPQNGTYAIAGAFARSNNAQFAGDGVSVSIFKNFDSGNPLFTGSISSSHAVNADDPFSGTGVVNFSFTGTLVRGDDLRFVVDSGSQQDASFDLTALQVSIRRLPALSPVSQSIAASGGSGATTISAPNDFGWAVTSNAGWITITSGASGTGNGAVTYSVAENSGASPRSGTITIGDQTFVVYQGINFLDVPSNDPFYNDIGKLAARNVTVGCGSGNFCPNSLVTREQMAAFIMRAKGEFNPPPPASQRFDDVPPENPFYNLIDRLAAVGITVGCSTTPPLYCPSAQVTREQMAVFILRALGQFNPPTPGSQRFDDVPPASSFYNFIDRMAVLGITVGCQASPPLYCPNASVTRAQMAAFLVRAFNL